MSPWRRVPLCAFVFVAALSASFAAPASAQFYDDARHLLGLSPDPIARSPRLLGYGLLNWVGDDPHNRITLWDFAQNPTGLSVDDTTSTVEFRPATASASSVRDELGGERQDLAARETRLGYELWRRDEGSAYGIAGNLGQLRYDRPFADTEEERSRLVQPTVMPVLAGKLPYTDSGRWLYAARLFYSGESSDDQYRLFTVNGENQFLDQDGTTVNPPNTFTPTHYKVRTMGGGAGVAWRAPLVTASIVADAIGDNIQGSNDDPLHHGGSSETRPYEIGQATLLGRIGRHFEWGADGRGWTSKSEQRWVYTVSAGIGLDPLEGRGKLLEREEKGTTLHTRALWTWGAFEVGGGINTAYRRLDITPPAAGDRTSFNYFLHTVSNRVGADTLSLPDSVSQNRIEDRSVDGGVGAQWRFAAGRGRVGAEYHVLREVLDQTLSGHGPKMTGWDVRTGAEYQITPVLAGRAGYRYRWYDQDALTAQNEHLGHTLTLGLGIQPTVARWTLDAGYAIEWLQADFGDPANPRGSDQQLAVQIHWGF